MNKHSPEPWSIECQSGGVSVVLDANGKLVFGYLFHDEDLPDLIRVVTAVNACAGLSEAELESRSGPQR